MKEQPKPDKQQKVKAADAKHAIDNAVNRWAKPWIFPIIISRSCVVIFVRSLFFLCFFLTMN
jgi:hypothetical protein